MSGWVKSLLIDVLAVTLIFIGGWDIGKFVEGRRSAPPSDASATVEAAELHLAQRLERVEQTVYRIEHDTAVLRSVRQP